MPFIVGPVGQPAQPQTAYSEEVKMGNVNVSLQHYVGYVV
jgi:hypothetical protein